MEKKVLHVLLVILFCLSYATTVPATRRSIIRKVDTFVLDHQEDLTIDLTSNEDLLDKKEHGLEEKRMMVDIADYPPTEPNPKHKPKVPPPAKLDYPPTEPDAKHKPIVPPPAKLDYPSTEPNAKHKPIVPPPAKLDYPPTEPNAKHKPIVPPPAKLDYHSTEPNAKHKPIVPPPAKL